MGARKNAYNLLVDIGKAFVRFCGNTKDALDEYLVLVYAGLTGSVTMITCTVLALTRLVFEYKGRPAECEPLPAGAVCVCGLDSV